MRYWTERSQELFHQLFQNIVPSETCTEPVMEYIRERIGYAIDIRSPEMVCAIMRFCDDNCDDSAKVRFATAIRAMDIKCYDIAYACWDDEGRSFLYVDSDPDFPRGVHSAEVLRDLCANMMNLQGKLRSQTEATIDGELCDLLQRVI